MSKSTHRFVGLDDVEVRHREDPRTFSIPRSEQRRNLKSGDVVKCVFGFAPETAKGFSAERMWVEVIQVASHGYVGRLANDPAFIADLAEGDRIDFEPRHVAALWVRDDAKRLPIGKLAVVSRQVADLDLWPSLVVRAEPPDDSHSGWIVFSGQESDAFRNDIDNFVPMTVNGLIQRFQVLDSVLDEPGPSAWRWDSEQLEYVLEAELSG